MVTARTTLKDADRNAFGACELQTGINPIVLSEWSVINGSPNSGRAPLTLTAAVTTTSEAKVRLVCRTIDDGVDAGHSALTAVKVTTTH